MWVGRPIIKCPQKKGIDPAAINNHPMTAVAVTGVNRNGAGAANAITNP